MISRNIVLKKRDVDKFLLIFDWSNYSYVEKRYQGSLIWTLKVVCWNTQEILIGIGNIKSMPRRSSGSRILRDNLSDTVGIGFNAGRMHIIISNSKYLHMNLTRTDLHTHAYTHAHTHTRAHAHALAHRNATRALEKIQVLVLNSSW